MTNETNFDAIDLSGAAPAKEPERQYYYMKKAREILAAKEAELGRKMQACIKTFGCQMNARDSEKLRGILELIGYELTEQEEADFGTVQYVYGTGKCESEGIWPTGLSERDQEKKSAYDYRTVRLYDAGAGGH